MLTRVVRFGPRVNNDIFLILRRSRKKFGNRTSIRYEMLLDQAIADLVQDAYRFGTQARFDLKSGLYFYHLKYSKPGIAVATDRIVKPRHLLVFRLPSANELHIIRILHERMKFKQQEFPIEYMDGGVE